MMTAWLVLASVGILLAVLIHGRVPAAIAFTVLAGIYLLAGLIQASAYLASFSNSALATLVVLLLVSIALERSPILGQLSRLLIRPGSATRAVFRLSGASVLASAFVNNTAVVGAFLGMVTHQRRIAPSKLLIPLSYASILGGICTLVGTSTNLVVNSFAVNAGLPALAMFQFTWVGVPVALVCLVVLALSARLLPVRETDSKRDAHAYFVEALIAADSPMAGKTIEANGLRNLDGLFLVEILRGGRLISPVGPETVLEPEDQLLFTGEVQKLQTMRQFKGLHVFGAPASSLLASNLVEVVISNESELAGRTLREVDFRTMFDAGVVAIRRGERRLTGQLGRIPLRVGDSLLLATGPDFRQHRNLDRNFHILNGDGLRPHLGRWQNRLVTGGFALVIALSALNWLPLLQGMMVLLALLLASGVLSLSEIRRRFPFELVLIIGSALAMATVLETSGAAALIAGGIRYVFQDYGVMGAFVGVYLMTLALTELVTNNAAAALAFPIALSTARAFGVDPTAFVMVVAYGASAGFLMPFGYQTHLMVYSAGHYRMGDFVRVGLPVSIAYSVCVLLLVPLVFPF
ncbi:SLC13 family permease [Allopusillimonas soli]|nr:SLC13 family permease [Allopusillimonas soli]